MTLKYKHWKEKGLWVSEIQISSRLWETQCSSLEIEARVKGCSQDLHRALEAQSCSCTHPVQPCLWFHLIPMHSSQKKKNGVSACTLWLQAGWWEEKQTALLLRTTSACCCLKQISLLLKRPGMMSCQALLQATPQGSCRFESNSKVVEKI